MMQARSFSYWAVVLALAVVYFASAKLGLALATLAEQVTVVWPPTGIALAAVLVLGWRIWPGITLGAFLANATAHEPLATACGIAVGNTLEALVGASLLHRIVRFDPALGRLRDVLGLVVLAAAASTTVSATLGVTSLCLGDVQPWTAFAALWWVWWLGDATGNLVVAPALLIWSTSPHRRWPARQVAEAAALLVTLIGVSLLVFAGRLATVTTASPLESAEVHGPLPAVTTVYPLHYAIFPFVIWAALRFGQAGTATVTLVAAAIAVWGTQRGCGPFGDAFAHGLHLLQLFMAVVAITALLLGAAIAERNLAQQRRAADLAVTRILAEATTRNDAAPQILRVIGEHLDWDVGALWMVDPPARDLHCVEIWNAPDVQAAKFLAVSRQRTFAPGVGLPGRVWASRQPAWIDNVVEDNNFPRAPVAAAEGLHGAFAFPIRLGKEILGVLEFFSRRIRRPEPDLLERMSTVGSQIGQFLERKRAEAQLRRSEQTLADFFENAAIGLHWVGPDGTVLRANQAALTLLGYARDEYVGRPLAQFHADAEVVADVLQRLQAGETLQNYEAQLRCQDGSLRQVLLEANVLWEEGRFIHARCFLRDITKQKRAEEALREADRRKDEFLAMLAHELRNPLAPIRNATHVLQMQDLKDPNLQWAREVIERQVQQLARLVDDLLDISRITRGQIQLRLELVELANVLNRAVETSRPLIEERQHTLTVGIPPQPLRVQADPIRLAQVLSNLLQNAAKYTEKGGQIRLTVERDGATAVVRVKDTGLGIPAAMLPRVFDLFTQVDRSLDRAQGGLGIGLTLVRRLVELHRGTVQAFSAGRGQGSEFVVWLPLAPEVPKRNPESPADRQDRKAAKSGHRILVVDDNRDAAESLGLLLRLLGHDVETAFDGPTALEAARASRPEIVLLDIGLPGIDGYEVARQLRQDFGPDQMLLVALTGYGQDEDRRRSQEAGLDHHLVKPVDPEVLVELLAHRSANRQVPPPQEQKTPRPGSNVGDTP